MLRDILDGNEWKRRQVLNILSKSIYTDQIADVGIKRGPGHKFLKPTGMHADIYERLWSESFLCTGAIGVLYSLLL